MFNAAVGGYMYGSSSAGGTANYIEDVFSTYLYQTNDSTQTITNGINLSANGGLMWFKTRTDGTQSHSWVDSARGNNAIYSDRTVAQDALRVNGGGAGSITLNTNGFTFSGSVFDNYGNINSGTTGPMVSWTFRKQPKFFDVVTYTGTGANTTIAHSLGAVPGCIMVKRTDTTADWAVYHSSLANTEYLVLNTTAAKATGATWWNSTTPTSSVFSVGTNSTVNASGGTYVAYLFADNAGGFGLTGSDNVISCGSYTGSDSTATTVTLGYEPQWIMIKRATGATSAYTGWAIFDNMRGMPVSGNDNTLLANTSDAENPATANGAFVSPTATGFTLNVPSSNLTNTTETFIYIAIRRGPMKVPTVGTSVFSPQYNASGATGTAITTNFPVDMQMQAYPPGDGFNSSVNDRLRGVSTTATQSTKQLVTSATTAEDSPNSTMTNFWNSTGFLKPQYYNGVPYISWNFQRAPSFFDEVCYTGNGPGTQAVSHNLGVVPELVITKVRSANIGWTVFQGSTTSMTGFLQLNTNSAAGGDTLNLSSTTITVNSTIGNGMNANGSTYVTYLFATCAGVSKVGRYTGTGATQTISCGFAGGARFVLVKRTDSTGDWYVWDTARGMVSGTDPSLLLNSTAAEVNANSIYTATGGFQIVSTAAGINASGGTYIFLAIA